MDKTGISPGEMDENKSKPTTRSTRRGEKVKRSTELGSTTTRSCDQTTSVFEEHQEFPTSMYGNMTFNRDRTSSIVWHVYAT